MHANKIDRTRSQSSNTADIFYSCNWQGAPTSIYETYIEPTTERHLVDCPSDKLFMKNLQFAIMRSQKPLILRAMKFSTLALNAFTRVSFGPFYRFTGACCLHNNWFSFCRSWVRQCRILHCCKRWLNAPKSTSKRQSNDFLFIFSFQFFLHFFDDEDEERK